MTQNTGKDFLSVSSLASTFTPVPLPFLTDLSSISKMAMVGLFLSTELAKALNIRKGHCMNIFLQGEK